MDIGSNGHGDPNPNAPRVDFRALLKQLPGMAGAARSRAKKKTQGFLYGPDGVKMEIGKLPRAICIVCATPHDYAMVAKKGWKPRSDVCLKCSAKLAEGYTAFVALRGHVICKAESLKDVAGKIMPITNETYKIVKAKFDEKKPENLS